MISRFSVQNYGCLSSVQLDLTPMHALIGPNDSGKSTALRALRTVVHFATGRYDLAGGLPPFDTALPAASAGAPIELAARTRAGTYTLRVDEHGHEEVARNDAGDEVRRRIVNNERVPWQEQPAKATVAELRGCRLLRLDPDALRQPSKLIPESSAIHFLDDRGLGLPGVYQAILGRGDDAFRDISEVVRSLFPTVKSLRVTAVSESHLAIEVALTDGTRVRAQHLSEGCLYVLAFAALAYLTPTALLLIEEPENGLHPARIAEVVSMIRNFSQATGTQIILATHSPLVVNEMRPEEVTLLTRPSLADGTRATPLQDTPNFAERASVYALGELWLSYADGIAEGPLLRGAGE